MFKKLLKQEIFKVDNLNKDQFEYYLIALAIAYLAENVVKASINIIFKREQYSA
jgi:hypothetical protein